MPMPAAAVASSASQDVAAAESAAARAYANRDFEAALAALDELVRQEPQELRWREMRAQVGGCLPAGGSHSAGLGLCTFGSMAC